MPEDAKNIWLNCVLWISSYFGCSKQLADIRIREWVKEYGHEPMKTVGFTSANMASLYHRNGKNMKRSEAQKKRFENPEEKEKIVKHLIQMSKTRKHSTKKKKSIDIQEEHYDMPDFNINNNYKDIIV